MRDLQEKFQMTMPPAAEEDNSWTDQRSVRKVGEAGQVTLQADNRTAAQNVVRKTNFTPPGQDIDNQKRVRINPMPFSIAGATDVSHDANTQAFEHGFDRLPMSPTDDLYSGEHMDHFYGEVVDEDGHEGFAERNNYLDRE